VKEGRLPINRNCGVTLAARSLAARWLGLLAMTVLLPGAGGAAAESRQFGRYEVLYSVFAADFLQPPIAQAYGIVRAADRAVLNITVRRRLDAGGDEAIAAVVSGTRGDLVHTRALEFREVSEPGARYYLADFPIRNDETQYFTVRIVPVGEAAALELRFDKRMFVD
jgi:hypothetical protein